MKTNLIWHFRKKKEGIRRRIKKIIQSRWLITIIIVLFLGIVSFGIANNIYIYYLQKNNINIFQIKNLILQFIKTELGKATEIGMVGANIVDGISFEDIRISAEEDFSNNKILFNSRRMDLRLGPIFSKSLQLEKIVFHNSKLEIEQDFELQKISKYLLDKNLPTIEFKNLVLILKKENEIFIRSTKPLNLLLLRKRDHFVIQGNDAVFFQKIFKQLQIRGIWDLTKEELELKIEVNNFPIEKIQGITKLISLFESQEGTVSGFMQYHSSSEETKIDGSLNFFSISGNFLTHYQIHSLTMNTQFSYLANEEGTYFNRKLNNPHFVCEIFYNKKANGNILHRVSGSFQDLKKLNWSREETQDLNIEGKIDFDLSLEEFSKGSEAFQVFGNLNLNNLSVSDTKTKFYLIIQDGGFRTDSSGEIRGSLIGSLYEQKFEFSLLGNLKYLRSKDLNSFIVQSNLNSKLELQKYIQTDYEPILGKTIQIIEDSIREQQEKMYLETYIVTRPFFRQFIEQMSFELLLKLKSFQNAPEEKSLGELNGTLKYSKNNLNFKLISNGETPFVDLELRGMIDRRNPYYDLRTKFKNYPWKKVLIDFCGYGILPNNLDLDLSLQTSGNNFSDMLARKSFNLEFEIRDFSWKLTNPQIASNFFIFKSSNWTTKGGFSGYGFEGYFRNLELFSNSASFKGYGSTTKIGSFQFNFWGQDSGGYKNWSIVTNGGEKCLVSIK